MVHKYPQNQSYVGSIRQTLTTNVSMILCRLQIRHQTHMLCGCTTFGTELKLGPKLIRSLPYCSLDKGVAIARAGGRADHLDLVGTKEFQCAFDREEAFLHKVCTVHTSQIKIKEI